MIAPINYNIDVQTPFQSALQGYQAGAAIRDDQAQQAQRAALQAQQQQKAQVIRNLISDPNAGAEQYSQAMLVIPELKDQLKQAWETKSTAQQQAHLSDMTQWASAIQNGQPQIAVDAMRQRADAMEAQNGGPTQDSQALRTQASVIEAHPDFGGFMMKAALMAAPGGDKVVNNIVAMNKDQREQDAVPLDQQKKEEDIKTAQTQRQIDALNVQIAQANSETERGKLQLERDKRQAEMDKTKQATAADAQGQLDNLNQTLSTVESLMNHPGLKSGTGTGGSLMAFFNSTDANDFRVQLETLKSQQFLSAVSQMRGSGALSDAEGARLEKAVASLDPGQSTKQFKNNLGVIRNTLQRAQAKLVASGKLPTSGGAFVMTHPVYGNVTEGDINRLMQQYPGSTRDQVIAFLKNSGGK